MDWKPSCGIGNAMPPTGTSCRRSLQDFALQLSATLPLSTSTIQPRCTCLAALRGRYGMPPSFYKRWPVLGQWYNILSTARDRKGVEYISTIEAKRYPFTGELRAAGRCGSSAVWSVHHTRACVHPCPTCACQLHCFPFVASFSFDTINLCYQALSGTLRSPPASLAWMRWVCTAHRQTSCRAVQEPDAAANVPLL